MKTLALTYLLGIAFLTMGTAIRESDTEEPAITAAGIIVGAGLFFSALILS